MDHLRLTRQIMLDLAQIVQLTAEFLAHAHTEILVSHAVNVMRKILHVKGILCLHYVTRCITLGLSIVNPRGNQMRTEVEIEAVMGKAVEAYHNASKVPGMTYEQGVRDALEWTLGNEDIFPLDED